MVSYITHKTGVFIMSKKVIVLIVLSFIFLILSVAVFAYDVIFISALKDVQNSSESEFGVAVAAATLAVIFVIFSAVFILVDTVNIIFSGILIKLTSNGWRVYYIVVTSLSVLMAAAVFVFYAIIQN